MADARSDPEISPAGIFLALFHAFVFRLPSFQQLESDSAHSYLQHWIGAERPFCDNTLRYSLCGFDLDPLEAMLVDVNRSQRLFAFRDYLVSDPDQPVPESQTLGTGTQWLRRKYPTSLPHSGWRCGFARHGSDVESGVNATSYDRIAGATRARSSVPVVAALGAADLCAFNNTKN